MFLPLWMVLYQVFLSSDSRLKSRIAILATEEVARSYVNYIWFRALLPTFSFLLARGADEATGMVGLAQGGHHLPLDEVLAAEAASPVHSLVVQSADVFTLPHEEASLGQFATTYCDKEGGVDRRMKKNKYR